jgi:serine phosphatase RsbU (regulator of sigma subunit)
MPIMEESQTRVVTFARNTDFALESRTHCLELIEGLSAGHRFIVAAPGVNIGRTSPADIVLADSEVSRTHCRLVLENDTLTVTDLNSTNGTFIDGVRISRPTPVPVGAILRIGRQSLKHEWLAQREILQRDEFERELKKANSYVEALLPAPIAEGPIRAEWLYEPCSKLGGDAFGYAPISDNQFMLYNLDVSGHGAGAAMHSVAIMNLLRQRTLPNADLADPTQVLTALNAMFPMEERAGMYFTMWYGVYDRVRRELTYASAGQHPGFLVASDREKAVALRTRSAPIGVDPATRYSAASAAVPEGAALYLFSDGVFEFVTIDGHEWGLNDFIPHLLQPPVPGLPESRRLYREVRGLAQPGGLDDDFSLLVLNFD